MYVRINRCIQGSVKLYDLTSMTLGTMNHGVNREELIQLEPLEHQVGGHSSMFVLGDVTVCKPLIGRESQFYHSLPPEMKQYVPEFRGTLKVVLQEDREGEPSLAALPNQHNTSLWSTHGALRRKLRRVSSGSVDLDSDSEDEPLPSTTNSRSNRSNISPLISATGSTTISQVPPLSTLPHSDPHISWLHRCHQTHLNKLKQKSDSSNVVECIMLENLTFKYDYPCILDLKMGSRQYGDDAPESKRRSQTEKASNTTSVTLGVRLAGMQVYNKEEKRYRTLTKYVGRQLNDDGFKNTLTDFLFNGRQFRSDIVEIVISKLKELRQIITNLDSFRFFTSSLLILYDSIDHNTNYKSIQRHRDNEYDWERERDRKSQESYKETSWADLRWQKTKIQKENSNKIGEPRNSASCYDTRREIDNTNLQDEVQDKPWEHSRWERDQSLIKTWDDHKVKDRTPSKQENKISEQDPAKHTAMHRDSCCSSGSIVPREQVTKSEIGPSYKPKSRYKSTLCKPKVDIRLIDFAHATHKGMGDPKVYNGPDDGIIFGMDCLIKIFQNIRDRDK